MNLKQEKMSALEEKCFVLADIVVTLRPIYSNATIRQKTYIETMIGAAIWYIPKSPNAWTGCVSIGALKAFHPDSKVENPRFSEEHVFPRKVVARELLEDPSLNRTKLINSFLEKFGQLHLITSEENKAVQKFQRISIFKNPEDAYKKAGIVMVKINEKDLLRIKRRNKEVIEKYLKTQK